MADEAYNQYGPISNTNKVKEVSTIRYKFQATE